MDFYDCLQFNFVATICATIFYLFLFINILSPTLRHHIVSFLTLPTPSTNIQIVSLDSIRGMAASIVAMAHVWNFAAPIFNATQQHWWRPLGIAGNKAVAVFVVLSGFLIYKAVKNIHSMEDLSRYVKRRFLRIYPVYIFSVLLGVLLGQMVFDVPNFLSNVFMVRAINPVYLKFISPPTWSLYVEILFYIMLPIWFITFKKRVLTSALLCFVILLFVDHLGSRELWLWKYFFIGIITSELADRSKGYISQRMGMVLFILGMLMIYFDLQVWKSKSYDWFNLLHIVPKNPIEYSIGLGLGCMCLLLGLIYSNRAARWMSYTPLRLLGVISYSLYLIHPFFIWAVFPKFQFSLVGGIQTLMDPVVRLPAWYCPFIMFPGCVLFALICYVFIERPFLLLRPTSTDFSRSNFIKNKLNPSVV